MKDNSAEYESQMFWRLSREIEQQVRDGEDLSENLDELDVLALHTTQPALRERCLALIARHTPAPEADKCQTPPLS